MSLRPARSARTSPGALAALGLACALAAGCTQGRVYQATHLPPRLTAAPNEDSKTLNLAGLATQSISSEQIERGDVLTVTIITSLGEEELAPTPIRVGEDGMANVPLIGPVAVAGLQLPEAERKIVSEAARREILSQPYVTVTMERQRTNRVTVIGAVKLPKDYELPRTNSTLLAALVAAGGLTPEAGQEVVIRRPVRRSALPALEPSRVAGGAEAELTAHEEPIGEASTIRIRLASAAEDGSAGAPLEDGDVVEIPLRAPRSIRVMGLVNKPDDYQIPPGEDWYLLDALAKAGGRTMELADKVWVLRRDPESGEMVKIQTSVREAKGLAAANVRLQAGDNVTVEETPATFVVDSLTRFMRFGFSSALPIF